MQTIQEQAALIPRPHLTGVETSPGHIEFNIARTAIQVEKPVQPSPAAPVAPEIPPYVPMTKRQKLVQWLDDAPIRLEDKREGTNLYAELQAKRKRERLFLRAANLGLLDTGVDSYKRELRRLAKRNNVS